MSKTVLCADNLCKHNNGGGYYGICNHPVVTHPIYTGGVDRLLMNTCPLRETKDGRIVITGGGRNAGKTFVTEAIKKCFEEEQNDCTETE